MQINRAGLDLLKSFEGWRSEAYQDVTGIWTIGYGHTSRAGAPEVYPGMTITREEGDAILLTDLERFSEAIGPHIKVTLNANQYSALLSFAYNVGPANFKKSSVLAYVNQKRFAEVPGRLALWTKAGGKVLRGLSRRRAAEGGLFLRPPDDESVRQEAKEVREAGGPVAQRKGKSAFQSTTNRAAAGLTLAVIVDQLKELIALAERGGNAVQDVSGLIPAGGGWVGLLWPMAFSLVALAVCAWIIRERMKKSIEHGV